MPSWEAASPRWAGIRRKGFGQDKRKPRAQGGRGRDRADATDVTSRRIVQSVKFEICAGHVEKPDAQK